MKNILFVITNFRHGGTNRSLQNLLSFIDLNEYCVDVFAMEHYGPFKTMLPNCTVLIKNPWLDALISRLDDRKGGAKLGSLIIKSLRNISRIVGFDLTNLILENTARHLESNKYDAAIAFSEGVPTTFVARLKTENKIAWIHCDYSSYLNLNNFPNEMDIYRSFKSIVCVSDYTKREFCRHYPSLENRTFAIHNIIDTRMIFKAVESSITDNRFTNDQFNIVSIGNIYALKRFSAIPLIAKTLIESGCHFKWYLIGAIENKDEYKALAENIKKYNVGDSFIWLGEKDNPYPYIAKSDLLVNLSVTEACPFVINEAKILHRIVICTDFGSAVEFIKDGENGYIAPIDQIVDKIRLIIKNHEEYKKIQTNLSNYIHDNGQLLKSIYQLL